VLGLPGISAHDARNGRSSWPECAPNGHETCYTALGTLTHPGITDNFPKRGAEIVKKCPFCAEDIQDAAKVCKHCGRDLPANDEATQAAAPNRGAAIGCAVILVALLGGCWWLTSVGDSPEAERRRADSTARAIVTVHCEAEMTRRLRSPGTADYPFGHVANVESLGGSRYRLRSHVDAQNAFGGTMRTSFVCVVEGSGDDVDGYRVTEFTISE